MASPCPHHHYLNMGLSGLRGAKTIITSGWALRAHGCCGLLGVAALLRRTTTPKRPQPPLRLRRTSSAAPDVLRLSYQFYGVIHHPWG